MKSQWIVAAVAACVFAFAPALGAAPAKPKPHAVVDTSGTVPVLPADVPLLTAAPAPAQVTPFVTPATLPCVTLAASKWTAGGGAKLCGLVSRFNNAVAAYPGIQYGSAARWTAPKPNALANQNLTGFGPACIQGAPKSNPDMAMSENCLFLNVWVPPSGAGKPLAVMVFIHGGAFLSGAGSAPVYDGTRFAGNNIILVTLNYRLGALGFLVGNKFGVSASGNFGIMDQQMALNWVHDNIAAFGGDPAKITIFGESAGAMSVGLHLFAMPSSTNFFSAAIMESNPVGLLYYPAASPGPSAIGNQFLSALCLKVNGLLGCGKTSKFNPMTAPAAAVVYAQGEGLLLAGLMADVKNGYTGIRGLPFQPVIDGKDLIMGQPYQGYVAGTVPKPLVFGTNQDEGAVFAAMVAAGSAIVTGNPSAKPSDKTYAMVVNGGFPQPSGGQTTAQILAAASPRYNTAGSNPPDYQPNAPYYNRNGQAASNTVLDYDFAIANIVTANNALATGNGTAATPVFAYHFNQAPLWDIYGHWAAKTLLKPAHFAEPDNGACDPKIGNFVCHAAELPYVFGTLADVVPPELGITVPAANQTLANTMNAAWAAFAANPANPGSIWTNVYTNAGGQNTAGKPAVMLNTTMPPAPGQVDPNNVYGIWSSWFAK